jgi:hypothetical protein
MMGASENRAKNSKMAADLVKRGYYHGKRFSKGLTNIPGLGEIGSAAYRRMQAAKKGR